MEAVIAIPDIIARHLVASPKELEREIKLSYALRLYRADRITEHEFGALLGLETRLEVDAVLKENDCFIDYTEDEVAEQRNALREVLGR
jgi:Uncharacterised protein family (UPF0175)